MTAEEFGAFAQLTTLVLGIYAVARTWRFAKALMWGSE